jgi:hypothetical protein
MFNKRQEAGREDCHGEDDRERYRQPLRRLEVPLVILVEPQRRPFGQGRKGALPKAALPGIRAPGAQQRTITPLTGGCPRG